MDFPSAIFDGYTAAMITTKQKDQFFFMEPVHYSVWLVCCCIVIVNTICLYHFDRLTLSMRRDSSSSSHDLYAILWMNFSTLLYQGKYRSINKSFVMFNKMHHYHQLFTQEILDGSTVYPPTRQNMDMYLRAFIRDWSRLAGSYGNGTLVDKQEW